VVTNYNPALVIAYFLSRGPRGLTQNILKLHLLVYVGSIPDKSSYPVATSNCLLDSLDASKAKGNVVVCIANVTATSRYIMKIAVQDAGGIGMVIVDDIQIFEAFDYGTFPATAVSKTSATEIFSYIKSNRGGHKLQSRSCYCIFFVKRTWRADPEHSQARHQHARCE
jgi:hypothetical protein